MKKLRSLPFTRKIIYSGAILTLSIIAAYLFFNYDDIYFTYSPKKATFSRLEKIRKEKKGKVIRYLDQQKTIGKTISNND